MLESEEIVNEGTNSDAYTLREKVEAVGPDAMTLVSALLSGVVTSPPDFARTRVVSVREFPIMCHRRIVANPSLMKSLTLIPTVTHTAEAVTQIGEAHLSVPLGRFCGGEITG